MTPWNEHVSQPYLLQQALHEVEQTSASRIGYNNNNNNISK